MSRDTLPSLSGFLLFFRILGLGVVGSRSHGLRRGAEIMSRFILACILAPAAQHCAVSSTHCLQNVAA